MMMIQVNQKVANAAMYIVNDVKTEMQHLLV